MASEEQLQEMVREFPDSPMGHFSLGKFYLEQRRYSEAAQSLEAAVRLDSEYAAAILALGDAYVGSKEVDKARQTYERARATRHGQKDLSFAEDIEQRLAEL